MTEHKSTADVIDALKLCCETMTVTDLALDFEAEISFSRQLFDVATIEGRLLQHLPVNTISECTTDEDIASQPPINCLDLQFLEYNVKPYPLTQDKHTLLNLLVDYVQTYDFTTVRDAGKSKRVEYIYEDLAGCQAFTIIEQEDAISLTHHDHH